jgi:hypothetical protein
MRQMTAQAEADAEILVAQEPQESSLHPGSLPDEHAVTHSHDARGGLSSS